MLINWFISGVAVFISAYVLPGVHVTDFVTALIVALVLGVINVIVKPILFVLTLPITLLTLGLFTFILNALMIMLADAFVKGFTVDGFIWALLFSLVLSIVNSFFLSLTSAK
jgi:putative membrane protein